MSHHALETLVVNTVHESPLTAATLVALSDSGEWAVIERDGQRLDAAVATGCLVRPRPGDTVLTFGGEDGLFVVQVLRRPGGGPATVSVPGGGPLAIAGESLSLTARRRLSLEGDRLDLRGRSLALVAEATTWLGKRITGVVERFQLSAQTHEINARTMVEKAVTRTAVVEETDTLRAETRLVKVGGMAAESAASKVVAVADDLRLDGQRITMG